ncbi:CU044_5270 family protein [Streptomyces sp. NPDC098781]|uniref:CU044_5270 family protein n=1 Tax=Streptomyces sp. NPDC098781 TaxID=3366097 RepID=UPI00381D7029
MNPAQRDERVERDELARLLPSPGEPVLSSDRRTLLQEHLMRELTTDPSDQTAKAGKARTRRRFAAIAVPLVTAAAVTATVLLGGSGNSAPDQQAVDLLNRIAKVAAAQTPAPVRDDQYVYVAAQYTENGDEYGAISLRRADWQPVDGRRSGLARIKVLPGSENPYIHSGDMKLGRDPNVTYYRELEALPTDPERLYRVIWDGTEGEGPTQEAAALEEIAAMLPSATLLPELNAALYRAAAKIPGVSVVENAEDLAGRKGVGLTFEDGDDQDTWVFDKKTLRFLGTDDEALLGVGIADRIGEVPRN